MKVFADRILYNANILPITQPEGVDSIAIRNGEILRVGLYSELRDLICSCTKFIDMKEKTIIPGFIDAHSHLIKKGMYLGWLDLSSVESLGELKKRVGEEKRKVQTGDWILGYDWDESKWGGNYPTRSDLEEVTSDCPLFLRRIDGHMAILNSKGIEELNLSSNLPHFNAKEGIVKESTVGKVEGQLREQTESVAGGVEKAVKLAKQHGTISFHDTVDKKLIKGLQRGFKKGYLDINAYLLVWYDLLDHLKELGLLQGFGERIEIGAMKVMIDGSIGARTAAMRTPYKDDPENKGKLLVDRSELSSLFSKANNAGLQIAAHAIGDRALDLTFDVFNEIAINEELRHRIEHFEMAREEHINNAARMGIIASMQPNFVAQWQGKGGLYDKRLGNDRRRMINPLKEMLRNDITLAFGSDCMPFDPIYGISGAVNHPNEENRLSIIEAIKSYTFGGAFASHQENRRGRIKKGRRADLTVLSEDPRKIEENKLQEIQIIATFIDGALKYNTDFRLRGEA